MPMPSLPAPGGRGGLVALMSLLLVVTMGGWAPSARADGAGMATLAVDGTDAAGRPRAETRAVSDDLVPAAATAQAGTTGGRRVLVVQTLLAGQAPTWSTGDLTAAVFGSGASAMAGFGSVADIVRAGSSTRATISGVVSPWVSVTIAPNQCDNAYSIAQQAAAKARTAGYDPASYDHVVYAFPRTESCWWHGMAVLGGRMIWLNGFNTPDGFPGVETLNHELGHNLGLVHASSVACPGSSSFGASGSLGDCTRTEYGDRFATMGNYHDGVLPFHNAYHAAALGWIPGAGVASVPSPGTYSILPLYAAGPSGVRALAVTRSDGTRLWIETRSTVLPFEAWPAGAPAVSGLILHVVRPGMAATTPSLLIDAHPATANMLDAPLLVGESLRDPLSATVTLTSIGSDGAFVVTLSGGTPAPSPTASTSPSPGASPGPTPSPSAVPSPTPIPSGGPSPSPGIVPTPSTCVRRTPVVSVSPASISIMRGGAATVTVVVRNADTGPCGPSTFGLSTMVTGRYPGVSATIAGATSISIAVGGTTTSTIRLAVAPSTAPGSLASVRATASRPTLPVSGSASISVSVR